MRGLLTWGAGRAKQLSSLRMAVRMATARLRVREQYAAVAALAHGTNGREARLALLVDREARLRCVQRHVLARIGAPWSALRCAAPEWSRVLQHEARPPSQQLHEKKCIVKTSHERRRKCS